MVRVSYSLTFMSPHPVQLACRLGLWEHDAPTCCHQSTESVAHALPHEHGSKIIWDGAIFGNTAQLQTFPAGIIKRIYCQKWEVGGAWGSSEKSSLHLMAFADRAPFVSHTTPDPSAHTFFSPPLLNLHRSLSKWPYLTTRRVCLYRRLCPVSAETRGPPSRFICDSI